MRQSLAFLAAGTALAAFALPALANNYVTEPSHTHASFEVTHFGAGINRARFDKEEGTVQFAPAAKTGRVELTIDAASISTGVAPFDRHLKSADFFDVEKHPSIKFVGDKFHFSGDKVTAVEGQITIKGQSHPVTLKASQFACYQSPMIKREVCGGLFEATIDRTQWGLNYGLGAIAGKDVRIIASVEAIKQ